MRSAVTGPGRSVEVRRATARDAKRLTLLVRTSRAYEGPYAPMVEGYRVGPDYIETHRVFVAADTGTGLVLGFYALIVSPPELDLMFVGDEAQGLGIGRVLIGHLKAEARRAGLTGVRIVSHPPSEGFYRSMGAEPVGTVLASPPAVMWDRPELTLGTD
ncbi:GNAT family N-acetyltransferase [Streptomyces finlayi]|uniref:GNAT family N-acetyltransferase n=1 Tax=Streptomyces finlayi TaxID=67296 RepID=A0A7G7BU41_9ACTN|nr:GNAT family N-acetyltransferase [Streptomyces finlayi]QNE78856.1 GNAT family N-acetyltransferase [Streptomyces finlayi]